VKLNEEAKTKKEIDSTINHKRFNAAHGCAMSPRWLWKRRERFM